MEIRFTLTPEEFAEGYRWMLRTSTLRYKIHYWTSRWLGVALGVSLIGIGLLEMVPYVGNLPLGIISLVIGLLALSAPVRFRLAIRKVYRLQNLGQEIVVTVNPEGLVIKRVTRDAETRYGWSAIERSLESKCLITMLPNKLQFIPLPKRAMTPAQQLELRALLAARVPGAASQPQPAGR